MRNKIAALGVLCLGAILQPSWVNANPLGGSVVGGSATATINGQGTSQVTIRQNSSQAIINWNSFSIAAGEMTKFIQPSGTASILNRVLSDNPSLIYGTLQANGRVFLVNPAGILVGRGGVINTRGFLASTFDIGNAAFLSASKLKFAGNSTASVQNEGSIQALGGDVFLIANSVQNRGAIQASGRVGLGAGSEVVLAQAGNERVSVVAGGSKAAVGTGIDNEGQIQAAEVELKAAGGNMYALAINNAGAIRATTVVNEGGKIYLRAGGGNIDNSGVLSVNSASGVGGSIVVDGGHNGVHPSTVLNSGAISATSFSGRGGTVHFSGDDVGLTDTGSIDVSGGTGGGTALVGGGFHGENPNIVDAQRTYIGPDATINADAVTSGRGGNVAVWSEQSTLFGGRISARGGAQGGNGGFAEVSSKNNLEFQGVADLSAPRGTKGTLLLDPKDILIASAGTNEITNVVLFADFSGSNSITISPETLSNQLNFSSVTLQANNNISYAAGVAITNGTGSSLTNLAGGSILLSNGVAIILTNGGIFSAVYNDTNANAAFREPGQAVFWMSNATISAPGGIYLQAGSLAQDRTGTTSVGANTGDMTLGNLNTTPNGNGLAGGNILAALTNGAVAGINVEGTLAASGSANNRTTGSGNNGGAGGTITLITSGTINHQGALVADGGGAVDNNAKGGGAGDIFLVGSNGVVLGGNVSAMGGSPGQGGIPGTNGAVLLEAAGLGISQTGGTLSSQDLLVLGQGAVNLGLSNSIGRLAGNVNGPFNFVNNTNLVIGTVFGVSGVSNADHTINISTVNGALTVNTNVDAGLSSVSLTAGSLGTENPLSITNGAAVLGAGGVTLVADHLGIAGNSSVSAGAGTVTIHPFDSGTVVRLGGADAPGVLGLSGAELTNISAGTLHIGSPASNFLAVAANLTFTNNLVLQTGAGIGLTNNLNVDGYDLTLDHDGALTGSGLATASALYLLGSGAVGANGTPLRVAVPTISLNKSGGNAYVVDSTGVNLQGSTPADLTVSANGRIAQTNALSVSGLLALNAGANDVVLTNTANNLSQVSSRAANAWFVTTNTLALFNSTIGTNLSVSTIGGLVVTNTQVGGSANLTNGGDLMLSDLTVGTNLFVQTGGNVSQLASLDVSNNLEVVTTGSGVNVLLGNLTNYIGQALVVTNSTGWVQNLALGNSAPGSFTNLSFPNQLTNLTLVFPNSAVTLGGVSVSSNLSVLAGGDITQSNSVAVGGNAAFNATTNFSIVLSDTNNGFNSVSVTASNATLANNGALILGASTVLSNLQVTAAGDISESGVLNVGGNSLFGLTAAGSNLRLGSQPNNFAGLVTVTGLVNVLDFRNVAADASVPFGFTAATNVTLQFDNSGMTFGNATIISNLTAIAGGNIGQSNGTSLVVGGKATFEATNFNVALNEPGNDFNSVALVASNATLQDVNGLVLDAPTMVTGDLTVTAGGDLMQNGALTVGGLARFFATNYNIVLENSGNNFNTVSLVASNAALAEANLVNLGASVVLSNLTVSAGSDITQVGALNVGGLASFSAPHSVTLQAPDNDFNAVALVASNATVVDANSVVLGDTSVGNNLTVSAGADISQDGAVRVGGLASLLATNGDVNMALPYANDFGSVLVVANNATLWDRNGVNLASAAIATNLTVIAGGDITQTGPLRVGGTTGLGLTTNGTSILLAGQPNDLGGPVEVATLSGVNLANLQLRNVSTNAGVPVLLGAFSVTNMTLQNDNAGLAFGSSLTVVSNLTATAGGDISQSNGTAVVVGGTATFLATNHDITLSGATNDFNTVVTVGNQVTLADANAINFGASTIANGLAVSAGGAISQSGALFVGGPAVLSALGDIHLDNGANDFVSPVTVVNGQAVTLTDMNGLTLGGNSASLSARANGGDLTFAGYTTVGVLAGSASGSILQTAPILAGASAIFNAQGDITLNNPNNDFAGLVSVVGGQLVDLADMNSLTVQGTALRLSARAFGGDLTLAGFTTTADLNAQASGNVSQTGPVLVGTTAALSAGGNILMNNPNNDFAGLVTVANGQAVNLADVNSLTVGGASASLAAQALGGDLTLAGYSTAGALSAQSSANIVQTAPVFVGSVSSLRAGGDITLNNANNDFGGLITIADAQAVFLADINNLSLGGKSASLTVQAVGDLTFNDYTTSGALNAQAGGNMLQNGLLAVGTTAALNAVGDITLDNPGNSFAGRVTVLNGQVVELGTMNNLQVAGASGSLSAHAYSGDVSLDGYTTTGSLAAQATGNIFQSGPLSVDGTATLEAGGNITLNSGNNDFGGLVTVVNGKAVDLVAANGLTVGGTSGSLNAQANGGDLNLASYSTAGALIGQASGSVVQSGPLSVGATANLTANGNITLNNVNNDFAGEVTIAKGQAVILADVNSLSLDGTSGSLDARAYGGSLALVNYVTTASLAAEASGDILQSGSVSVGSSASLSAGGNISQNAALSVGGTAALSAGGNIALDNPNNAFGGLVTVGSGQAVTLVGNPSLSVGGSSSSLNAEARAGQLYLFGYSTSGSLRAQANGDIAQSGALNVGTTANLNAGGNIILNDAAANEFGGLITVAKGQVVDLASLNNLNIAGGSASLAADSLHGDVVLGAYVTSGALTAQAGGNISQAGGLQVGTLGTFNAAGNILLPDNLNTFGTLALSSSGGALLQVSEANSMMLESINAPQSDVLLNSAASIGQDAATAITAKGLAANAFSGVTLVNPNAVQNLAGTLSGRGEFEFKDVNAVTVSAVAGVTGITALHPGSQVTLDADRIGISSSISAGPNLVLLQPVSTAGNLRIGGPFVAPSTSLEYSGLNNVKARTLQIGNNATFNGNIIVAQSISLTNLSATPYRPTPVSTFTNDATTLSLQTRGGTISNLFSGSWATVDVPRLSLVGSNATFLGDLANSSDVSYLAWRSGNPIRFVDANTLDLLWVNTSLIGANQPPSGRPSDYQPIDTVFGATPITGNDILFNGGGVPAQQFANSLVPFNGVELPLTKLTLSVVYADFNMKEYGAKIDALLPGAIWRSFAQIPFTPQVPLEDLIKPESSSKWVHGYLGISGSTGAPQQSAY